MQPQQQPAATIVSRKKRQQQQAQEMPIKNENFKFIYSFNAVIWRGGKQLIKLQANVRLKDGWQIDSHSRNQSETHEIDGVEKTLRREFYEFCFKRNRN